MQVNAREYQAWRTERQMHNERVHSEWLARHDKHTRMPRLLDTSVESFIEFEEQRKRFMSAH